MTPLLELENVRAGYEDSIAIDGVSLTVGEGEVVCLLGANGAGKTTTMRAVTGLIPLAGGKIIYRGRDISTMPTHLRVAEGICLAPEGRQIFPELTVLENLRLGSFCTRARAKRDVTMEQVFSLFPRLKERVDQDAGSMSGGEQQMLAIGRALMGQPKLLALDEPSLGLAPKIMMTVFDSIRAIAKAADYDFSGGAEHARRADRRATGLRLGHWPRRLRRQRRTAGAVGNGAAGIRRREAARPW